MFFGLFDGFFGEDSLGQATEMALEMCLLDEIMQEEGGLSPDWLDTEDDN